MGPKKFLATYLLSGAAGNALSCIVNPNMPVRPRCLLKHLRARVHAEPVIAAISERVESDIFAVQTFGQKQFRWYSMISYASSIFRSTMTIIV